jgi:hypothetical protein
LEVRFKLFQVFTSVSIEKEISLEDFLKSYPSVLNNQQKTKLKKSLIELLKLLEEYHLLRLYGWSISLDSEITESDNTINVRQ